MKRLSIILLVLLGLFLIGEQNVAEEKQMPKVCNLSITFQVYRLNMTASTIAELQGDRLAKFKVDGGFVSGSDTVVAIKTRVCCL
ncbi:MAG: hypothetical protein GY757_23615 [bacterium]|nr:hypothetical protein [bacterium]